MPVKWTPSWLPGGRWSNRACRLPRSRFSSTASSRPARRPCSSLYLPLKGERARPASSPEARGLANFTDAALQALVTRLDREGFQTHMHAIGDRGVRQGLDAIEAADRANGHRDRRAHIAHIQLVDPADQPRFAALGVVANMQPLWAFADSFITDLTEPRLGPARSQDPYPFASLVRLARGWPAAATGR